MKHKILIAIILFFAINASAQLSTNLIVAPQPPATLSKWATTTGTLTLVVNNQQSPRKAKIRTTLKMVDGTEVSITDMNLAQTIIFNDGQTLLNASNVYPLEIQKFTGSYQNGLNKTGKLPAGNYQICVELVEPSTYVPIALQKCATFYLAAMQLPICMLPANDQELNADVAKTAITFRWTPLVPKPQSATRYRLQVFEVLDNQQPMQALRSNQPILDQTVTEVTQYIWQPKGILDRNATEVTEEKMNANDSTKSASSIDSVAARTTRPNGQDDGNPFPPKNVQRFIWTIQTLDALNNPISIDANYEGRSEPVVFKVKYNGNHLTSVSKAAGCVCAGTSWGSIDCKPQASPTPIAPLLIGWNSLGTSCPISGYSFHRTTTTQFKSTYNCLPGCQVFLKYELYNIGGTLLSTQGGTNGTPVKFFMPQTLGNYYIRISAACDVAGVCAVCQINFTVVP